MSIEGIASVHDSLQGLLHWMSSLSDVPPPVHDTLPLPYSSPPSLSHPDPLLSRLCVTEREKDGKPNVSYIALIGMAILSSPQRKLLLSEVYEWIRSNFSYFQGRGAGWRNSVRHNLSLNECFVKAGRASNGKGHYWRIHEACIDDFARGDFSRRNAQRKVRVYLGLSVDPSDSPPSSLSSTLPPLFSPSLHLLLQPKKSFTIDSLLSSSC